MPQYSYFLIHIHNTAENILTKPVLCIMLVLAKYEYKHSQKTRIL